MWVQVPPRVQGEKTGVKIIVEWETDVGLESEENRLWSWGWFWQDEYKTGLSVANDIDGARHAARSFVGEAGRLELKEVKFSDSFIAQTMTFEEYF